MASIGCQAMRASASLAMGEPVAAWTSKNLRRTCAQPPASTIRPPANSSLNPSPESGLQRPRTGAAVGVDETAELLQMSLRMFAPRFLFRQWASAPQPRSPRPRPLPARPSLIAPPGRCPAPRAPARTARPRAPASLRIARTRPVNIAPIGISAERSRPGRPAHRHRANDPLQRGQIVGQIVGYHRHAGSC